MLTLAITSDSLSLTEVQNIANTRYYTNGFDVSAFGYSLLLPGTPRSYGGSISYRF